MIGLDDILRRTGSTIGSRGSFGTSSRKLSSIWWTWMIESWGIAKGGAFGRIVSSKIIGIVGTQGKGNEGWGSDSHEFETYGNIDSWKWHPLRQK